MRRSKVGLVWQRWLCLLSCSLQTSLFEAVQAMSGSAGWALAVVPETGSVVLTALPFDVVMMV